MNFKDLNLDLLEETRDGRTLRAEIEEALQDAAQKIDSGLYRQNKATITVKIALARMDEGLFVADAAVAQSPFTRARNAKVCQMATDGRLKAQAAHQTDITSLLTRDQEEQA